VSPKIIQVKIAHLQQVLLDLKPHIHASQEKQMQTHYEIERQVQLAVDLAVDAGRRWLLINKHPVPNNAREVFIALENKKLIPKGLAKKLADATGLRNILVHEYDDLDYNLFFGGLKKGFHAFVKFTAAVVRGLNTKKT